MTSSIYGSGESVIFDPPHIILSGNYIFDQELLSADRWVNYEIIRNQKLEILTKSRIKKLKEIQRNIFLYEQELDRERISQLDQNVLGEGSRIRFKPI